ncbi:EamA family transporter RarD [Novosphingobium mangrovi (ex Huang et al. 2023)]|uniref:EamA family transporter RarD n=1 Tax=Novosphingobium mangrovi (ex Huang et al. 2023) TaxID=2976432 RepID=A0ABT2I0D5_9SPHN|nr:EamA family transporter RarD [Novosphingobium mangrovi (ex Huang et al. 2023)]MCT2398264.1 EamA family transporter RarD [Novosphingobium mangrovi (ex Huang et al. 2023)]
MSSKTPIRLGGLAPAFGAYLIWTLFPFYFALLSTVSPFEVVAWRMLCTLPFCLIMVAVLRQGGELRQALLTPRILGALALSGLLIGTNWLVYVIAVMHGHVLATSLGYYINPLVNVFIGAVVLHEKLSRLQWAAVGLAAIGVAILAHDALPTLWISMALALSFAGYGLTRKLAPVNSLPGLTVETLVLLVPAIGLLGWQASSPEGLMMGTTPGLSVLLACAGILTGIPLLLFASAARRLDFSVLGFIQFVTPTGLFLQSLFVFGEPFRPVQLVCFLFIWVAIALFCWDLLSKRGRSQRPGKA